MAYRLHTWESRMFVTVAGIIIRLIKDERRFPGD